ncbi:Zinc transporter ZIP13, partial [Stegodyphus mimosarum]
MLTTFAILIHEIPHEISDFAILLKSGFNPWNAVKAQVSTAAIGILGAIVALSAGSVDKVGACTSWILPFTSGGFLNIALVNVLPDLLKEKDPWESLKQMVCLCGGIGVMALVNIFVH